MKALKKKIMAVLMSVLTVITGLYAPVIAHAAPAEPTTGTLTKGDQLIYMGWGTNYFTVDYDNDDNTYSRNAFCIVPELSAPADGDYSLTAADQTMTKLVYYCAGAPGESQSELNPTSQSGEKDAFVNSHLMLSCYYCENVINDPDWTRGLTSEAVSNFEAEEKFKEGVKGSSGSETKTSGYGASSPDGDRGTSGGGSGSSGAGGAEGVGTGPAAETTAKTAEHTKDAAATVASGGAYAPVKAVKTVKKALNAAKKVAESVKRKMEPKDYEAQNRRMGYGQPMEQNANGTSDRKTRKMADKIKPLIAVASISVMPIVAAMATTVSIFFLFLVPVLGFASTDTIYPPSEAMADEDYLLIKTEMEKYIGMPYVWAGDRPETSFDCSGLTACVYGRALGISLPHSAQGQYDMSTPVAPENAKPGDLVFFYGTYETDKYITHVGIYAGEGIMYEAGGGGIKYTDFTTAYWVEHFVGFGRVVKEP